VRECSRRLEREFKAGEQPMEVWQQVKLHYIGLLVDHHQPELAETFFNSVTTKILHRSYFQNDFIFVRPAISTEYIENDEPAAGPPTAPTTRARDLRETLVRIVRELRLQREFEDLERDALPCWRAAAPMGLDHVRCAPTSRSRCCPACSTATRAPTWWARSSTASARLPFALPILHNAAGKLVIDAALFGEDDLLMLFSFARAYFMVDMEIPRPTCSSCAA
jgi:isocitrate dehydrogenase kinase/phosphatase